MAHRHNRRRVRPRSRKHHSANFYAPDLEHIRFSPLLPNATVDPYINQKEDHSHAQSQLPYVPPPPTTAGSLCSWNSIYSPDFRYRGRAPSTSSSSSIQEQRRWQTCESLQTPQATKLEVEQCRLFGGEPGDDVALCFRMLEYFGRLDYIDP